MQPSILLIAARSAGVERIIIIGSADEYGNQVVEGPLNESLELHPVSPYAMSKAAATGVALAMHASNGLPVVILRPFTVYGPGQPRNMFVSEAIDCAVRGEAFRMSEGCQTRDLVYIDDAIRAFLAAAQAPDVEGKVINIGSGRAYALRDVAELIWRLSETRAPLMIGARNAGADELHDTWADVTRARALLGWEATTSLEEGLRLTIEWATAEHLTTQAESRT